jgi:hypothetical protein
MLDEQSKQKVKELCDRIAKEQDHRQFSILIAQLNDVLEGSDVRSSDGNRSAPSDGERSFTLSQQKAP